MPDVRLGSVARGSSKLAGYVTKPEGHRAVIAIHEVFGVDDVMRRQADRLGAAGRTALGRRCLASHRDVLRRAPRILTR
jgi:carboxymethylenebutenolidase